MKKDKIFFTDDSLETLEAERCQESGDEDVGEEGGVLQLADSAIRYKVHLFPE